MNMIGVDNERSALYELEDAIRQAAPDAMVSYFQSARQALEYACEVPVDVAFLDIEMPEMNGLALARHLKEIRGETNIIFITGYSCYLAKAFQLHASGYLFKPVSPEDVREELEHLRNPVVGSDIGVRIQCFGNFELFVDGKPVIFGRPKSKEALAYLVDRKGAGVSKKELAAILWEDKPYTHSIQSHLYILITELENTLEEEGVYGLFVKKRGVYGVNPAEVSCDYYSYNRGEIWAVNSYQGEYMKDYSWAEFTTGSLSGR